MNYEFIPQPASVFISCYSNKNKVAGKQQGALKLQCAKAVTVRYSAQIITFLTTSEMKTALAGITGI